MSIGERYLNYFKMLVLCSIAVLITAFVNKKGDVDIAGAIVGLVILIVISLLALLISEIKAVKKIPSFAWASLISLILTTPWCPLHDFVLQYTDHEDYLPAQTLYICQSCSDRYAGDD